jgi:hypothetical protein
MIYARASLFLKTFGSSFETAKRPHQRALWRDNTHKA